MKDWMALLLQQLLTSITPQLRKAVVEFVTKLETEAKETVNPWDDIFVGVLKFVLVIK